MRKRGQSKIIALLVILGKMCRCHAIHEIAGEVYTEYQCLAWSSRNPNYEHWQKRCELKRPFITEVNGEVAGFLELDPDGHIDCAYVNLDFKRLGVMTCLVKHAVKTIADMKLGKLWVDASYCIKPLFEREGFSVLSQKDVQIGDQTLVNFRMERVIR